MKARAEDRFRQILQTAAGDSEYQALQDRCIELDLPFLAAAGEGPPGRNGLHLRLGRIDSAADGDRL